jgi:signal transduction histidine kinase
MDKYPHIDIYDLLSYANIESEYVDDDQAWFSQAQVDLFFDWISKHFECPEDISREAGRYAYSDITLGIVEHFTVDMLGLGFVYEKASEFANKITKSSIYSSRKIGKNKFEITVEILPGVKEHPLQEHNRIGMIEAGPLLFSDRIAKVDASSKGNKKIYTIQWRMPKSYYYDKLKKILIATGVPIILGSFFLKGYHFFFLSTFFLLILFSILNHKYWQFKHREHKALREEQLENIQRAISSYVDDRNNIKRLHEAANIVFESTNLDAMIKNICELLVRLEYKKVSFFISSLISNQINCIHNIGYSQKITNFKINIDEINTNKELSVPKYFEDAISLKSRFPLETHSYFHDIDFPLIFTPILYDKSIIGFFWASPKNSGSLFKVKKLNFLEGISSHIALGIHRTIAYDAIVENDKMRSDFISTASHELNTPIQMLFMIYNDLEATRDLKFNLPLIKSELLNLREIAKRFLDFKNTPEKRLNLSMLSVDQIFLELKFKIDAMAKFFKHELIFELPAENETIYCDLNKIITILLNLVNNSCKYTPKNGIIIIRYTASTSMNTFDVIDNGFGIPKGATDKVFISFFQCNQKNSESVGGVGLGLTIAKQLVQLHNGDINIISPIPIDFNMPGRFKDSLNSDRPGTCVTVHLPKGSYL